MNALTAVPMGLIRCPYPLLLPTGLSLAIAVVGMAVIAYCAIQRLRIETYSLHSRPALQH